MSIAWTRLLKNIPVFIKLGNRLFPNYNGVINRKMAKCQANPDNYDTDIEDLYLDELTGT